MDIFFTIIEYIGIIAFSVAGAMIAIDKEADIAGVLILALTTAFGGGIMRDLFLGYVPPRFFTEYYVEIAVSVTSALLVFIFASIYKKTFLEKEKTIGFVNNFFDAAGLGIFSVYSANMAVEMGHTDPIVVISMGVIASVGGGLVRDLILRDIPFIIRKHVYFVAALLGASVYYVFFVLLSVNPVAASFAGFFITFVLRIMATVFKWNLPKAILFSKLSQDEPTAKNAEKEAEEIIEVKNI